MTRFRSNARILLIPPSPHGLAMFIRDWPGCDHISFFLQSFGEGHLDAAHRFGGGRLNNRDLFNAYAFYRGIAYRLGYALGRGHARRYEFGGYAWLPWGQGHRSPYEKGSPDLSGVTREAMKILAGGTKLP